jgi:alkylation response protein AidB-like acyl-CoA dehydrogenase
MAMIIEILIFLLAVGAVSYYRLTPLAWAITLGVVLAVLTVFTSMPWWLFIPLWIITGVAAATFLLPQVREKIFMRKVFTLFKHLLPPISQTEQEALDAGDVWWEGDLFRGTPDWQKLHDMPKPTLTAEEQAFLDNQVTTLCNMLSDWKIVQQERDLPDAVWKYLKEEGFWGLVIDKKYGGHGFSALAHSTIVSRISSRSVSAAVTVMVPNSLGPGELIYHYGTQQQKDYYLPRLAKGQEIPCFGLTSPEAGSDAASITDSGVVCRGMYQGKEVLGIRLNWDKRYITLAPVATVLGLAFKLYDPDHLLGDKKDIGITVCLVPSDEPGVEIGARHFPMGIAFMNGPMRGKDVFIPLDYVIGGPSMIGQGWRMLMECLSIGRGISLPAIANSVGAICYRTTGAYARIRKQFKTAIANFEGVEESLARIAGFSYLLDAARTMTAGAVDQKIKPSVASAIAKYQMTEISRQVIDDAMDIHSGRGIQLGPRNYLAHGYYGLPISITVEGANILTRNLIIFGQGAMRCHPFIRSEIAAANDADTAKGYKEFDNLLCKHMGYTASNFVKTLFYGLTGGYFIKVPEAGKLTKYYRYLSRMSTALAFVADIAMMVLGGDLKRKERLSARLGDVLSQLYLASTVLKYFQDNNKPAEEIPYVEWCMQTCLHRAQAAFHDFFTNFPQRWLGTLLSIVVFPVDHSFRHGPSDELDHEIVKAMLTDSDVRKRLSAGCMMQLTTTDAIGLIELAFQHVLASSEAEKKLSQAIRDGKVAKAAGRNTQLETAVTAGVLSAAEAQQLAETDKLVADAIAVDEFSHEQLTGKVTSWLKQAHKTPANV